MTTLNKKQHLFVQAFAGDVVEAMQTAGYEGAPASLKLKGEMLLAQPSIIEAIKDRSKYSMKNKRAIATREDRQEFWTRIMKNEDPDAKPEVDPKTGISLPPGNLPLAARLKASEMLGKSEADFMDKLDLTGSVTVSEVITQAYEVPYENLTELEEQAMQRINKAKEKRALPEHVVEKKKEDIEDLI